MLPLNRGVYSGSSHIFSHRDWPISKHAWFLVMKQMFKQNYGHKFLWISSTDSIKLNEDILKVNYSRSLPCRCSSHLLSNHEVIFKESSKPSFSSVHIASSMLEKKKIKPELLHT